MSLFMYLSITGENKIAIYEIDQDSGSLNWKYDVKTGKGVMPLVVDKSQKYLYAGLRGEPSVQTFNLNQMTGEIKSLGSTPLEWDTTYMSLDKTGRFLLSASYGHGIVGVHEVGTNNIINEQVFDRKRTGKAAHYLQTDDSNQFVFVPHVADTNMISQFRVNEQTGELSSNEPSEVLQPLNMGPRHYCHHPNLDILYVDNEQGNSITTYNFDPVGGTLKAVQTISTLPINFSGENSCAQIHIHPSGRFIYSSNRGHNSIACFTIDKASGLLTSTGQVPTEETPRAFNLDPQGRFLYAAGQGTGRLASYRVDQETGGLSPLGVYEVGLSPSWVLVLDLNK